MLFPIHIIILHLDLAEKDYESFHCQYFFVFPLRKGVLGNTILNREVREDITIKSKALKATLRGKAKKEQMSKPEVAANVLERKSQEATMARTE